MGKGVEEQAERRGETEIRTRREEGKLKWNGNGKGPERRESLKIAPHKPE